MGEELGVSELDLRDVGIEKGRKKRWKVNFLMVWLFLFRVLASASVSERQRLDERGEEVKSRSLDCTSKTRGHTNCTPELTCLWTERSCDNYKGITVHDGRFHCEPLGAYK